MLVVPEEEKTPTYYCQVNLTENYDPHETALIIAEMFNKMGYEAKVEQHRVTVKLKDEEVFFESQVPSFALFSKDYKMVMSVEKHRKTFEIEFCPIKVKVFTKWVVLVSVENNIMTIAFTEP